jgi:hypothetical protein
MNKRNVFAKLIESSVVAAFLLASCNTMASPAGTASPTTLLNPGTSTTTATSIASATVPPTPAPTATELSTLTPQLTPMTNPGMNAYCRRGPGTGYYIVTYLHVGTNYTIIAQNGLNTWYLVQVSKNVSCWMGDPTSVMQGPLWKVPILLVPPLPFTPGEFKSAYTCDSTLQSLSVTLTWDDVKYAAGYRIYRNGKSLDVVGPNSNTFQDNAAPYLGGVFYELEAFNDLGVADRTAVSIPSCD